MNAMIDTHCHLFDEEFANDVDAVIERARAAGVARAIVMGENAEDNQRILDADDFDGFVLRAAGHYPSDPDVDRAAETIAFIREHHEALTAIGEVGIDHRITDDPSEIEAQHEIFRRMANLSAGLDLPLSVHSRSAGRHAIALLLDSPARRVVLHAFDGKYGSAIPAVEAGYCFSVPPSIVRSRQKQKLVKNLPLSCLLLESDAPVLGPEPDERNEPCNIVRSAEAVADLHGIAVQEVIETTTANARELFRLDRVRSTPKE